MSEEELHKDVFNPNESDLEYFQRRQRELAPAGRTLAVLVNTVNNSP